MIQEFSLETDSIQKLESTLKVMIPLLFSKNGNESVGLHLKQEKPSSFDNGVDYREYFDLQEHVLSFVPDQQQKPIHLTTQSERTYAGVVVDRVTDKYLELDEAVAAVGNRYRKLPIPIPRRTWITTLADYKDTSYKKSLKCRSYEDLLTKTLEIIKSFDSQKFFQECESGYCSWFNSDDGIIKMGYRLQQRLKGGFECLDISAIHIYYGK